MWHDRGDCNSSQMDLDVLIVSNNKTSFSHIFQSARNMVLQLCFALCEENHIVRHLNLFYILTVQLTSFSISSMIVSFTVLNFNISVDPIVTFSISSMSALLFLTSIFLLILLQHLLHLGLKCCMAKSQKLQ